jgi:hypothetical protein
MRLSYVSNCVFQLLLKQWEEKGEFFCMFEGPNDSNLLYQASEVTSKVVSNRMNMFNIHGSVHRSMTQEKWPTRRNLVIQFIIPPFIKGSTCFERHTAHHEELELYLQPLVYIRMWWPAVVKSEWERQFRVSKWTSALCSITVSMYIRVSKWTKAVCSITVALYIRVSICTKLSASSHRGPLLYK